MNSHSKHMLRIATIRQGDRGRATNKTVSWGRFIERLQQVHVDRQHSMVEYQKLSVDDKNKAKDQGSFVLGHFESNIRKRENVKWRSGVALDVDSADPEQMELLRMGLTGVCDYEFFGTTTRSHTYLKPKWRLIFPTTKLIPAEHYPAVSRILSAKVFATLEESMEAVDDVSHRVAQIMYWPSRSHDGPFEILHNPGKLLDHETLLASWPDWQDWSKLPYAESRGLKRPGQAAPAERPNLKQGLVGAFCRTYSVPEAMERFIPGVYVDPKRERDNIRYTYSKGHGSSGAIVVDDGLFLYSHHGTDPCGERLVNAFDMVRLHLYGHEDKRDDDATPTKQPSFRAMRDLLQSDARVKRMEQRMADERVDAMFEALDPLADDEDDILGELPAKAAAPAAAVEDEDYDDILGAPKARPGTATDDADLPRYVREFNERHAFLEIGGKMRVARRRKDGSYSFMQMGDFYNLYLNRKVPKPNSTAMWSVAEAWAEHPARRTLYGVTFDPTYDDANDPEPLLNLWNGFAIEPDPNASCALFLRHLREVVCSNKQEYDYLIGWLAHMIQRPEEIPEVAVVLKGKKGTGKDTVGHYLKPILGRMHIDVGNQSTVFNNFNKHMENCLFMQLQEAFWAGDKKHEGYLKYIISSSHIQIEPKGLDGYEIKSLMRLFMTTNEKWAVPASSDERRFFVLLVKPTHMQDSDGWFKRINEERDNGGAAALLHFLLTYDLSRFNVRRVPQTEGLQQQKEMAYRGLDLFWLTALREGVLPGVDALETDASPDDEAWENGPVRIHARAFYTVYENWTKSSRSEYRPLDPVHFGRDLREMCPGVESVQIRNAERKKVRFYRLPSLAECRRMWEKHTGSNVKWDSDSFVDEANVNDNAPETEFFDVI